MLKQPLLSQELPQISSEAQTLYLYCLNCVQTESYSQVLEQFRCLFIEVEEYRDQQISQALKKIINSKRVGQEFPLILYRCSQILIHTWYQKKSTQSAIPELINLLTFESSSKINSRQISKEWKLCIKNFSKTQQYHQLKRLLFVINPEIFLTNHHPQCLGRLLNRYPFLYKYCLLDQDSIKEYRIMLSRIKTNQQKEFELLMVKYVTSKGRTYSKNMSHQVQEKSYEIPQAIQNPSLLNEAELVMALKHFIRLVKTKHNQLKWLKSDPNMPFALFKKSLIDYLLRDLDELSSRQQLQKYLEENVPNILSNCDAQPLNEFLILRTCSQLLNLFILKPNQNANSLSIIKLTTELGTTQIVGVFLKLILLAPKIKPHLEKQLAGLFSDNELMEQNQVNWLVKLLENVLIALSIYRGTIELPSTVLDTINLISC